MVKDAHLDILVHPLVLLNMSDYWNRSDKVCSDDKKRVIGICLGRQVGRQLSIETSFELPVPTLVDGESWSIDDPFLEARLEQYKQVFPNLEPVGWFSVSEGGVCAFESSINKHLATTFDNLLVIHLDRSKMGNSDSKDALDLPLTIWEAQIGIGEKFSLDFVEHSWKLETSEAERIAVDHVSKAQTTHEEGDEFEGSEKTLIAHYTTQSNAIKMLSARIALLKGYVSGVKHGSVKADATLLKQINALLQRLPVMQSTLFAKEFREEEGDVLLTRHLNEIMKGTRTLSELVDMHAAIKPRQAARGAAGWM